MLSNKSALAIGLLSAALACNSLAASPEGVWKTIDDATGEARSYVTITANNGTLSGTISEILDPANADSICSACEGERKDQKIAGMTILWDMAQKGDKYDDGKIIDPESGKIYSANMKVLEGGKKLEVRGYIGFSLIGRSQIWERLEQ